MAAYASIRAHIRHSKETCMRRILLVIATVLLALPLGAQAQDSKAALEKVGEALGAHLVTSIEYVGSGVLYAPGQSQTPGTAWLKFIAQSYTRTINYDTAAIRDHVVRMQGENPPRGGGVQPVRGAVPQI